MPYSLSNIRPNLAQYKRRAQVAIAALQGRPIISRVHFTAPVRITGMNRGYVADNFFDSRWRDDPPVSWEVGWFGTPGAAE